MLLAAGCGGGGNNASQGTATTTTAPGHGHLGGPDDDQSRRPPAPRHRRRRRPSTTARLHQPSSPSTSVPDDHSGRRTTRWPGRQPAGGPVPSGFDPLSFTAISADQYWLLGEAPCSNPVCTSIVRTTDGGAHFVGLPAPTAPITTTGGGINTLRFADTLDGYAFATGPGGEFWDTHDGGEQWVAAGVPVRAGPVGLRHRRRVRLCPRRLVPARELLQTSYSTVRPSGPTSGAPSPSPGCRAGSTSWRP